MSVPFVKFLKGLLARSAQRKPTADRRRGVRLQLEQLEERCVPSANASGVVDGTLFINQDQSSNSTILSGMSVTLSGTTSQGSSVSASAITNSSGAFNFTNVLPGSYQLSLGTMTGYVTTGSSISPSFSVAAGQTVNQDLTYVGGLDPNFITMRQFLTSTTSADYPSVSAGDGQGTANYRPNNAPTVSTPLDNMSVEVSSAASLIDLAGHFSDPDMTNSQVTFHVTYGGTNYDIAVTLDDTTAPQTVANFLDYVKSGRYDNTFFTRLVSGFVLQGGGAALNADGTSITPVATNPAIPNEFSASNAQYTLAMALAGSDINSATDQYFFNLSSNNASSLDPSRFTVFGSVTDVNSIISLITLANASVKDESKSPAAAANPTVLLNALPLTGYSGSSFPSDASKSNYMVINNITIDKQDEFLTYTATSSNPSLVSASINDEWLTLNHAANQTGTATIMVTATDRYGASVSQSFQVNLVAQAPTITGVTIAPDNASNTTSLTATPTGNDPQGASISYAYQWLKNGTPISGATSATLTLDQSTTVTNDQFSVAVTPSDSFVIGAPFTSNSVTVSSTGPIILQPPAVQSVTIAADNSSNATKLSAAVVSSSPATFTYQWLLNGQPLSGETSSALTLTGLTVNTGDIFAVQVTPNLGALSGSTALSNQITITGVNPIKTA
jgi:cyclophilin family peptidyl-prolyl cis-trans isomerase